LSDQSGEHFLYMLHMSAKAIAYDSEERRHLSPG
jgi:hypothetical protein